MTAKATQKQIKKLIYYNLIILFVFFVFSPCEASTLDEETVPAQTYYDDNGIFVSLYGSDTLGNGSIDNPYRTIQYVLDNIAQSGATVILRGGTYSEAIRIRNSNITIRSKSDEWAKIETPVNDENIDTTVLFDVDSDYSKIQRLEVVGGYYYGIMFFTKWDWGDPNDRTGATNITIEDCKIHDTGRDSIKITPGSDFNTIRRCEIYNSGIGYPLDTPDEDKNAEGIDIVNADNILIQDSYIHNIATTGVYLKGGSICGIVERVNVEHCGGLGIVLGFDTSPEYFDLTVNPNYYESINGIVRNCIVSDVSYGGIALYAAQNPQLYNNTIVNTAKKGHSPIYFGITFQDWDVNAKRPPNINPIIKNNIVLQTENITNPCVSIRYSTELGGLSALSGGVLMDNNLYYRSGSCLFEDNRIDHLLQNANLSQWKVHINGEYNSLEAIPLLSDNYHLQAGSPCNNSGVTIAPVSYDIDCTKRTEKYDIGADEYNASINKSMPWLMLLLDEK